MLTKEEIEKLKNYPKDVDGEWTPLLKEIYFMLTKKNKELPETIEQFAERLVKGERMTSPEDMQFYKNNTEAIETHLKNTKAYP